MERFFKQWRRQGSGRSALDEWFIEDTFVYSQFLQIPVARGAIKYIVRFENGIKSRSIEKALFVIILHKSLRYQIRMGILVLDLTDGTFHYYGPLVNNFVRHHVSNFARFLTTLNVRGLNNYKDIRLTYYFELQILFPRMVNLGGPVTACPDRDDKGFSTSSSSKNRIKK